MTQEEQRITIAEACGWHPLTPADLTLSEKMIYGDKWWRNPEDKTVACLANLPDYLNDLNACAEFEKVLNEAQNERYVFWLNHLHPSADIHYSEIQKYVRLEVFSLIHATAAQKCEAFRRTLNI